MKEEFEAYRDKCLEGCKAFYSKGEDIKDWLTEKIEDPDEGYENFKKYHQYQNDIHRLKELAYDYYKSIGEEFWGTGLCDWLNQKLIYTPSIHGRGFSMSSKQLEEAGYQEGDEIWEWSTPKETWDSMCGMAGYCIVRDGEVIWSQINEEN
jgi:hypothetical protein